MKAKRSKQILERLAKREALERKANFTFSINKSLMDQFRTTCSKRDLKMAPIVEELIRQFLEDTGV